MLELILGRAGTGKTTLLRKRLAESTAPKTILIVPEFNIRLNPNARCLWNTVLKPRIVCRCTALRALRRRHFCSTAAVQASV